MKNKDLLRNAIGEDNPEYQAMLETYDEEWLNQEADYRFPENKKEYVDLNEVVATEEETSEEEYDDFFTFDNEDHNPLEILDKN